MFSIAKLQLFSYKTKQNDNKKQKGIVNLI